MKTEPTSAVSNNDYTNPDVEIIRKSQPRVERNAPIEEGEVEKRPKVDDDDEGTTYDGEWKIGTEIRQGMGIQTWPDGSVYEGNFYDNKRNGNGRIIYPDQTIYNGGWVNDAAHGYGELIQASGSYTYKGEWLMDHMHGQGTTTDQEGTFEGEFQESKRQGRGKFTYIVGGFYDG